MVEWLAGNRLLGTNAERLATPFAPTNFGSWVEVGRTILGSAASSITVSSLPNKRYYKVLTHITGESSNSDIGIRFNADSAANYSVRGAYDGNEFTAANINEGVWHTTDAGGTSPFFDVGYIANKSDKEKLYINHGVRQMVGTPPERSETVGRWSKSPSEVISSITLKTGGAPTFNSGSEVVVLGYDPSDINLTSYWQDLSTTTLTSTASTINSGTITAKKYLWVQAFIKQASTYSVEMHVNGDTGSTYRARYSGNGGADASGTFNKFAGNYSAGAGGYFLNIFILNDSSTEKLGITHNCEVPTTGAGAAPNRLEWVSKWLTTGVQITSIDFTKETGTGDLQSGSILKVWGAN